MTPQASGNASTNPALLAEALSSAGTAIFITDNRGHIVWCNEAFMHLTGYDTQELQAATPRMLKSGRHDDARYQALWETISAGAVWKGEMVDRRKDGSLYVVDEVIAPLFDAQGNVTHYVAVQNELNVRDQERVHEHYLAYHDALTGLGNRTVFLSRLQATIDEATASGQSCAALFIDLDRFKPVNDCFGHHIGDGLLIAVAQRLRAGVRKGDTVARLGGDEFGIVLSGALDREIAAALAAKLVEAISRPFQVEGKNVQVGASLGIAMFPAHGDSRDRLLESADQAMYVAKRSGGGYRFALGVADANELH